MNDFTHLIINFNETQTSETKCTEVCRSNYPAYAGFNICFKITRIDEFSQVKHNAFIKSYYDSTEVIIWGLLSFMNLAICNPPAPAVRDSIIIIAEKCFLVRKAFIY